MPNQPPDAGVSAQREYERRRIARRDRARARYGIFGTAAARFRAEPGSTRAWKQGAQGEIRVAWELERQVADVTAALVKLGAGGVWVRGALCYPFVDGLPRFGRLEAREGRVIIDDPRGVAKLARRRGTLDAQQVALLAEGLARRLPGA